MNDKLYRFGGCRLYIYYDRFLDRLVMNRGNNNKSANPTHRSRGNYNRTSVRRRGKRK